MKNKKDQVLQRHVFEVNPQSNGGEGLMITTEFIGNGDPITPTEGVYITQEISLQSYCNSATFNLTTMALTPEVLRRLANELEQTQNKIQQHKH